MATDRLRADHSLRLDGDGRSLTVDLPLGACTVRLQSWAAGLAARNGTSSISSLGSCLIEVGDAAAQQFELPAAAPPPDAPLR